MSALSMLSVDFDLAERQALAHRLERMPLQRFAQAFGLLRGLGLADRLEVTAFAWAGSASVDSALHSQEDCGCSAKQLIIARISVLHT